MTIQKTQNYYSKRYILLNVALAICMLGLIYRMVHLSVIHRDFLQRQGDARTVRVINIPAYRGMITDRNGDPLAVSTPVDAVWVSPKDFAEQTPEISKLAKLLGISHTALQQRIAQAQNRDFLYLKRGISPHLSQQVQALKIPGVFVQHEFHRYYPQAESMAHVLGFTNIDDHGQEGIELVYNDWLSGKPGKKRVLKDRLGHTIADLALLAEPVPGNNVTLSIDKRIQYLAYSALKESVTEHNATSGSIIVLDVTTGEVLAMVNSPSFNPNAIVRHHDSSYRNRAATDLFEPGSALKAFSIASALASGHFTPQSMIDTAPGWIVVGSNIIRDVHPSGLLSVTGVMQQSSNVGVTKMVLAQPPQDLVRLLQSVGFGQRTKTDFPGESAGVFVTQKNWQPFAIATLSFGYGISVTAVQLAQAYSIFANHGNLIPVTLLRRDKPPAGQRVLSAKHADEMLQMLTAVVEDGGTGSLARIPGFLVAGKTGTSRKVGKGGYEAHHHIASFVGIAPADRPRLLVLVVINDPQKGSYYGGSTAAPVFASVMRDSLRVLNVYSTQEKRTDNQKNKQHA